MMFYYIASWQPTEQRLFIRYMDTQDTRDTRDTRDARDTRDTQATQDTRDTQATSWFALKDKYHHYRALNKLNTKTIGFFKSAFLILMIIITS